MDSPLEHTPVVILAGGLGTRLRPALPDRPKGLAPIGERSFLEVQIQLLRRHGARRFVLCVGRRAGDVQVALGDGRTLGVQIEYSVEQEDRLMGTAGALKQAERYFAPFAVVLNGDTYFDIEYARLLQRHLEARQRQGALATLALSRLSQRDRYGNVLLDPSGQTILAFQERLADPPAASGWVSGGAYVIERALLDYVPPDRACSLERDVFPRALAQGRTLAAATFPHEFFDIGTPDTWKKFADFYQELPDGER